MWYFPNQGPVDRWRTEEKYLFISIWSNTFIPSNIEILCLSFLSLFIEWNKFFNFQVDQQLQNSEKRTKPWKKNVKLLCKIVQELVPLCACCWINYFCMSAAIVRRTVNWSINVCWPLCDYVDWCESNMNQTFVTFCWIKLGHLSVTL